MDSEQAKWYYYQFFDIGRYIFVAGLNEDPGS